MKFVLTTRRTASNCGVFRTGFTIPFILVRDAVRAMLQQPLFSGIGADVTVAYAHPFSSARYLLPQHPVCTLRSAVSPPNPCTTRAILSLRNTSHPGRSYIAQRILPSRIVGRPGDIRLYIAADDLSCWSARDRRHCFSSASSRGRTDKNEVPRKLIFFASTSSK